MIERALDRDVAAALADTTVSSPSKSKLSESFGRIISPSWPTNVSVKRMNMLGCLGSSRPTSAACERSSRRRRGFYADWE